MARPSPHEQALRLLAGRAHFRAELRRKLLARGYEPAEVEEALARCAEQGYLDDAATARTFTAERQERRGLGRVRIAAELRRRGAGSEAVMAALADSSDEDELARARDAAARWRRRGAPAAAASGDDDADAEARRARHAALARHLDRKGFSRRAIVAVLAEAGTSSDVDLDDAAPAD